MSVATDVDEGLNKWRKRIRGIPCSMLLSLVNENNSLTKRRKLEKWQEIKKKKKSN